MTSGITFSLAPLRQRGSMHNTLSSVWFVCPATLRVPRQNLLQPAVIMAGCPQNNYTTLLVLVLSELVNTTGQSHIMNGSTEWLCFPLVKLSSFPWPVPDVMDEDGTNGYSKRQLKILRSLLRWVVASRSWEGLCTLMFTASSDSLDLNIGSLEGVQNDHS